MPVLNEALIRLYDTAFNRAPDPEGLAFWNAVADSGTSLSAIAGRFIAAPEFAGGAQPNNTTFVQGLFQSVLDRSGEFEGVSFWASALDRGLASRPDIVVAFSESLEHIQQLAAPAVPPPGATPPGDEPPLTLPPQPTLPPDLDRDLSGSKNDDRLDGAGGNDRIATFHGNDVLRGFAGRDTLLGGVHDDLLEGGPGDDLLDGGLSQDVLSGGLGADIFLFSNGKAADPAGTGGGNDIILDFAPEDRVIIDDVTPARARWTLNDATGLELAYPPFTGAESHIKFIGLTNADLDWVWSSILWA